jgi:hypothetical protein
MSNKGVSASPLPRGAARLQLERLRLGAMILAAGAGAAVLYARDPATPGFFPECPFHRLTGLYCPGCGSTRALYQLLHGHLSQAVAYNPAMVAALPFLGYAFITYVRRVVWGLPRGEGRLPAGLIWAIAGALSLFWVLRNLLFAPLTYLAPHALGHQGR